MKIVCLFFLPIVFVGCELVVDVDLPRHESKVNVFGFVTPDSAVYVHLSKSIDITDADFVHGISDAIITVTHPDQQVSTLIGNPDGHYYYSMPNDKPKHTGTYKLRVQTTDGATVEASTIIPERAIVLDSAISRVQRTGLPAGEAFIELLIEDGPHNEYYFISVSAEQSYTDSETGEVIKFLNPLEIEMSGLTETGSDVGFADHYQAYFSDRFFNGLNKKLKLKCTFYMDETFPPIVVYVGKYSEDFWKLKSTVRLARIANDNPFAQPVQVYSNVQNGLGVFAGYSLRAIRFE